MLGWQCPNCGQGNAPFVAQCPCGPQVKVTTEIHDTKIGDVYSTTNKSSGLVR